jgi:hypothetical protein
MQKVYQGTLVKLTDITNYHNTEHDTPLSDNITNQTCLSNLLYYLFIYIFIGLLLLLLSVNIFNRVSFV